MNGGGEATTTSCEVGAINPTQLVKLLISWKIKQQKQKNIKYLNIAFTHFSPLLCIYCRLLLTKPLCCLGPTIDRERKLDLLGGTAIIDGGSYPRTTSRLSVFCSPNH